jgi:hypothetical protein
VHVVRSSDFSERLNASHAGPNAILRRVTRAHVAYRRHLHFKPLGSGPPPDTTVQARGMRPETLSGIRTDSPVGNTRIETSETLRGLFDGTLPFDSSSNIN